MKQPKGLLLTVGDVGLIHQLDRRLIHLHDGTRQQPVGLADVLAFYLVVQVQLGQRLAQADHRLQLADGYLVLHVHCLLVRPPHLHVVSAQVLGRLLC